MNIKGVINNYTECNRFEIKYVNGRVYVYYYKKIENFTNKEITIIADKKYKIIGNKLIIDELKKEVISISGLIKSIVIDNNE